MSRVTRYCLLAILPLVFLSPTLAFDEDAVLGPDLQWTLADAAWQRREYDDAAALLVAFGTANTDHINVLDAWWRAYEIYRAYRPNKDRKQTCYEKGINACVQWENKYAKSDKERMAKALWYHAQFLNREGGRVQAIQKLELLFDSYAGSRYDSDAHWHLAEWLREAKRYAEAIPHYDARREALGRNEWGAVAAYRAAWCYQELNDIDGMKAVLKHVLDNADTKGKYLYHWHWHHVRTGAIDIAKRLKTVGEDGMANAFLKAIVEHCPKDWGETKQAAQMLGIELTSPLHLWIHPHYQYHYNSSRYSVSGGTQVDLTRKVGQLLRVRNVPKDETYSATFAVIPKVKVRGAPKEMASTNVDGKEAYTVDVSTKGNKDWWFWFTEEKQKSRLPDGVVITREWEKQGNDWGMCTVRVQANSRWEIYIYLPNNKTNVNNLNWQPNQVLDGGKTFRWYQWYDLNKGRTIKFPVEVGTKVQEFYPRVYLSRGVGSPYKRKDAKDAEFQYDTNEYTVRLTAEDPFPTSAWCNAGQYINMEQIMK